MSCDDIRSHFSSVFRASVAEEQTRLRASEEQARRTQAAMIASGDLVLVPRRDLIGEHGADATLSTGPLENERPIMRRLIPLLVVLLACAAPAAAQPGTVMPNPIFVGLDNNGNPCGDCHLYVYTAGTTTASTTYQDAALTTPNTVPFITLDGNGRAKVFLSPASSYRFDLKSSADALIWSVDNVAATFANGNVITSLSPFFYATVRSVASSTTLYCVQNGSNPADQILETTGAGSFSVALDALANCATGRLFNIKQLGTGTITIDPNGTETIDGATTYTIRNPYTSITIYKSPSGTWSIQ